MWRNLPYGSEETYLMGVEMHQIELLHQIKSVYELSTKVIDAFLKVPRHLYLTRFSSDFISWPEVTEKTLPIIYSDIPLLLYERQNFLSTQPKPSLLMKLLNLLDLEEGMSVYEVGSGSGWTIAMISHLIGTTGELMSYEIIPEMAQQAKIHLEKNHCLRCEVIQGDALSLMNRSEEYDRGIFSTSSWDIPGIVFENIKVGGKLIFPLKTGRGDFILGLRRETDHFHVFEIVQGGLDLMTGNGVRYFTNDLSEIFSMKGQITVWPQGTIGLKGYTINGRDVIFQIE